MRASALAALRGVYERQHEWQQALDTYRQLARIKAAPPRLVAAHYLCELAALEIERGAIDAARSLLRQARRETAPFPRAALLRAQIAERQHDRELALRLLRTALARIARTSCRRSCRTCSRSWAPSGATRFCRSSSAQARERGGADLKRLVFAAIAADLAGAAPLRDALETVFDAGRDARCDVAGGRRRGSSASLTKSVHCSNHAERYRCSECGFSGRSFYWHCPACQSWQTFESYALVKLR